MKRRSPKSFQTIFLSCSNVKSIVKVPLNLNKFEKTKRKNFDFFHFSFSFFFCNYNLKSMQCMWILNKPNDCSANLLQSYLFWALCELWVESYGLKLSISHFTFSCVHFLAFTQYLCECGTYSRATPRLLNLFARN